MIREQFRVKGNARARYVRKAAGRDFYQWCIQSADDAGFDIAQGICESEDLPPDIKKKCDEAVASSFYTCEWPLK